MCFAPLCVASFYVASFFVAYFFVASFFVAYFFVAYFFVVPFFPAYFFLASFLLQKLQKLQFLASLTFLVFLSFLQGFPKYDAISAMQWEIKQCHEIHFLPPDLRFAATIAFARNVSVRIISANNPMCWCKCDGISAALKEVKQR